MFAPRHHNALAVVAALLLALVAARFLHRTTPPTDPGTTPNPVNGLRFDPNTATADQLATIPGLGPTNAQALIAHREANPDTPFQSLPDLRQIPGIGPGTLDRIGPYLRFPDPPPPDTRPAYP